MAKIKAKPASRYPLLTLYDSVKTKKQASKKHGERYSLEEKDMALYEYLLAGRAYHQFRSANLPTISRSTILRHLSASTKHLNDGRPVTLREGALTFANHSVFLLGIVDVVGLKDYLISNGLPLAIMLAEDGTGLTRQAQCDPRTNTLTGCVAPLDDDGLPVRNYFDATDAYRVIEHLATCPLATTAYVQLAIPLSPKAAPYVLFYMATDNTFKYSDVLRRWKYTIALLKAHGIEVLAVGSDGDTTLLKAMVTLTNFLCKPSFELGKYFTISAEQSPIAFQDTLHLLNKIRRRLFARPGSLVLGSSEPTVEHLDTLVKYHSKDKHGLTVADLNPTDLMSFKPTEKIMRRDVIDFMERNVKGCEGTVALLRNMLGIYRAFTEENMAPLERISICWFGLQLSSLFPYHSSIFFHRQALLFMRAWRNWTVLHKSCQSSCITANAYACLELNTHGLVLAARRCRDHRVPEQFIVQRFGSQDVEGTFRGLRSMTTMKHTQTSFTFKDLGSKLRRAHMIQQIEYRNQHMFKFPNRRPGTAKSSWHLPSDAEIKVAIDSAKDSVSRVLIALGIPPAELSFKMSLIATGDPEWDYLVNETPDPIDTVETPDRPSSLYERIFEADRLFLNFTGSLKLRDSETESNTYLVKDNRGEVHRVKKETVVWLASGIRVKSRSAREVRYRQPKRPVVNRNHKPRRRKAEGSRAANGGNNLSTIETSSEQRVPAKPEFSDGKTVRFVEGDECGPAAVLVKPENAESSSSGSCVVSILLSFG